jgi:hypothetical protein
MFLQFHAEAVAEDDLDVGMIVFRDLSLETTEYQEY